MVSTPRSASPAATRSPTRLMYFTGVESSIRTAMRIAAVPLSIDNGGWRIASSMDSFFVRFKNSLVLIAIMVVQVVALALQVPRASGDLPGSRADGRKISTLRYWTFAVVSPFERLTHGSSLSVRHIWSNYIDLRHTREQNLELQQEIVRLRQEQEAF